MTRLIDADVFEVYGATVPDGMDAESYMEGTCEVLEKIDAMPTVDAVPVYFIESEIKRMELELDIAMSEDDDETAERWIIRKTTLEFTLEKWRSEREEE